MSLGNRATQFDSSGRPLYNSTLPTNTPTNEQKESIRPHTLHIMRNSVARTNRFIVEFMNANGLQREDTARLLLSAESAVLPGKSYSTHDGVRIGGHYTPYPYVRTFGNIFDMTFRVGEDMFERLLFDVWQDEIMNPITQNFNYPDNYTNDIRIHQLDLQSNRVYTVEVEYAFPKEIGALNLSTDESNGYHKQIVTFGYKKHSVVGLNDLDTFKRLYDIGPNSFANDTTTIFAANGEEILGRSIHRQPLEIGDNKKHYTGILALLNMLGNNRENIKNIANRVRTYNKGLGNPLGRGANEILKGIEGFPGFKSL